MSPSTSRSAKRSRPRPTAWLAGIGRYWDNPKAHAWQIAGLGSLAYVFVLTLILWLVILPLRPQNWSYLNVLTFVCLTSPPAVLYAIPVERFLEPDLARSTNAWFLGLVATFRVALLLHYLRRGARLDLPVALVAALLPLGLIVLTLAVLNLEHVIFNLMSGIQAENVSPNDSAYLVVMTLAMLSYALSPILLLAYLFMIWLVRRAPRK
jgi:hypothetical protein